MPPSNPPDTELKKIARELAAASDGIWCDVRQAEAILAALKSVRDAGQQRIEVLEGALREIAFYMPVVVDRRDEQWKVLLDDVYRLKRMAANARAAISPTETTPLPAPSESDVRRRYAHFRALAICARELLTNEAVACKGTALKARLLDAAKVINDDLRADTALPICGDTPERPTPAGLPVSGISSDERAALDMFIVREGRIDTVIASMEDLQRKMNGEYFAGFESLFRTWSEHLACNITALRARGAADLHARLSAAATEEKQNA